MDELLVASISSTAAVLAVVFGLAVAFLLFIRVRNPILVRMAFRNVLRRPGQSMLILGRLMLATAIIASAFTVGDSVTHSIKNSASTSLRAVDELLVVDEDSEVWQGRALPAGFQESVFQELAPALEADPDLDGVLPALSEDVAVINVESQQFESSVMLAGLDPQRALTFDELFDTGGDPFDLSVLAPNEVYITKGGAEDLGAEPGSVLSVALGPGAPASVTVRGVVDGAYIRAEGTDVVLMAARALGAPQRWVFTGAGLFLVAYWLIPHSVLESFKEDFTEDMSGFFLVGTFLVTGAVVVTVNNAAIVLALASKTIGRVRRYAPVVKSHRGLPAQVPLSDGVVPNHVRHCDLFRDRHGDLCGRTRQPPQQPGPAGWRLLKLSDSCAPI